MWYFEKKKLVFMADNHVYMYVFLDGGSLVYFFTKCVFYVTTVFFIWSIARMIRLNVFMKTASFSP